MSEDGIKKFRRGRISRQFLICMLSIIIGIILLIFILNTILLEKVYRVEKQHTMSESFRILSDAASSGRLYEEDFGVEIERLCANGNLSVLVIKSDSSIMISSQGKNENDFMVKMLMDTLFGGHREKENIIEATDDYIMQENYDPRMNASFLMLLGYLPDGNIVMIRTAVESIEESVKVTNRFIAAAGLFALVISVIVAGLLSRRITRPILELTDISSRMKALDFDAKYQPRSSVNEVDVLGQHMNDMSDTLKDTIKQLKQANLELSKDIEAREKAEEMRKEFISNVSHELKTPIALIQGYAEGLSDGIVDDPEDRKYYCDVIIDEAQKMNRLVQEMLTLNRLEYGQSTMQMERFDVTEMIRGIIEQTGVLSEKFGAEVSLLTDRPFNVWADPFFTERIVVNYLTNAIHYAKGEKKVTVDIKENEKEVRIEVFNTGDNIPEDVMPHIWEKFYKADPARTREYGGSGIGLSVVKAVADSFGKECGAKNLEDGVLFYFTLDK